MINTILTVLCIIGIGLLVYSEATHNKKRSKITERASFVVMWIAFFILFVISFIQYRASRSTLDWILLMLTGIPVLFYTGCLLLSFSGRFKGKNKQE